MSARCESRVRSALVKARIVPQQDTVDFKRPRTELGPFDGAGSEFIEQGGVLFCWSESNIRYEPAWWLDVDAPDSALTRALRAERPDPRNRP